MITCTLVVSRFTVLVDYNVKKTDKLQYQGSGIDIYIRRVDSVTLASKRDTINHQAQLVASAHNIPLVSLRDVRRQEPRKKTNKSHERMDKML